MKWLAALIILLSTHAHAKIFSFTRAKVATFITGEYGSSLLGDNAYSNTSAGNVFDKGAPTQFAGEVGAIFNLGAFNFLLAAEILRPATVGGAKGSTANGAQLMTVDSQVNAIMGVVGLEYLFIGGPTNRFLFGLSGGYADVRVTNDYTLNSAGQTLYTAVAKNHSEKFSGFGLSGKAYLGFEFLMTANVTMHFDLGYRYFQAMNFQYVSGVTTLTGDKNKGETVKDHNNQDLQLNLGGAYGALGFRFYFL